MGSTEIDVFASPSGQNRSVLTQWFHMTLGLAAATLEATDAGIRTGRTTSGRVYTAVVQVTQPLRAPLDWLGVTDLAGRQFEAFTMQVATTIEQLEARGAASAVQSAKITERSATEIVDGIVRRLRDDSELIDLLFAQLNWILPKLGEVPAIKEFVRSQVAGILPELADDPAVTEVIRGQVAVLLPELANDPAVTQVIRAQVAALLPELLPELAQDAGIQQLIRAQAAAYLAYLNEHPDEVQALIRNQGDVYINYLNAHPAQVQTLLQGQSLGLASQVRDEIRERTVTADGLVDAVVRNILRLPPREALAPPPLKVQRRAQSAHLPEDEDGRPNGYR
jgi:hypothetical protein